MANIRLQNAMAKIPQETPPIWCMRQAGRYHGHYQALRKRHSFMELCKQANLAADVALGPMRDFDFDVAILFSDLLFPLEALGMGLSYEETGPRLAWHLTEKNLRDLDSPEAAAKALVFQGDAMRATRALLPPDKSLIGFVGGPWTLFTYAVEGKHAGSLVRTKQELRIFPAFSEIMEQVLLRNIDSQIQSGAELVMIFDTAAGELSPSLFAEMIVPGLERLARVFPRKIAYYAKGTTESHYRDPFFTKNTLVGLGLDHRLDLREAFRWGTSGFIQGNFDQSLLCLDSREFRTHLEHYAKSLKGLSPEARAGWVAGLGHGVLPQAKEENVRHYVKYLREVFHG